MLDADYKQLLKSMQLEPKTYKCIADDWDVKQVEWYHALISIENLPIILAIPDLKMYAWCRDTAQNFFRLSMFVVFET